MISMGFFILYIFLPFILVLGFIVIGVIMFASKRKKEKAEEQEKTIDFP